MQNMDEFVARYVIMTKLRVNDIDDIMMIIANCADITMILLDAIYIYPLREYESLYMTIYNDYEIDTKRIYYKHTILTLVASRSYYKFVELLISDNDVDVNHIGSCAVGPVGITLCNAIKFNKNGEINEIAEKSDMLIKLMESGRYDVEYRTIFGYTLLHSAVKFPDVVRYICKRYPHMINAVSDDNITPLIIACIYGWRASAKILMECPECDPTIGSYSGKSAYELVQNRMPIISKMIEQRRI